MIIQVVVVNGSYTYRAVGESGGGELKQEVDGGVDRSRRRAVTTVT